MVAGTEYPGARWCTRTVRPTVQSMAGPDIDPAVRDLSRRLLPDAPELAERMTKRIQAAEPLYGDGRVVSHEELLRSCTENVRFVLGRIAGGAGASAEAPRATGELRAEQGVPLSGVMLAYRIGGRYIWELFVEHADDATRETLLRCAADIWAVSDELAEVAIGAYRSASADRARHDSQLRGALLTSLLDGKLGDGSLLWESAQLLKLPPQGTFVVVAAECPTAGEEALPRIETALARRDTVSAWRLDAELQAGVVSLRPRFDLAALCDVLTEIAVGRVGVSATYARLDETAAGLRQARVACAAATPRTRELVRYDERPIAVLIASAPEAAEAVARGVLGRLLDLPDEDRALVVETVRVWLAERGATSAAAERLHLHRNTVRYRLRRLEELSGRSLTDPVGVAEVGLALECARILDLS